MADASDNEKNPAVLSSRADQAKAGVGVADAELGKAVAQRDLAKNNMVRADALKNASPPPGGPPNPNAPVAIAGTEYDKAVCDLAVAEADVKKAQAQIDLAKAKLSEAQILLALAHKPG